MEVIRGKCASCMDITALNEKLVGHASVHLDIGTGDGKFVRHVAQINTDRFVIGIDACRENLRPVSRCVPENALFVIANAQSLPFELYGLASRVTINFPWGSLLEGLLKGDESLMASLKSVAKSGADFEIRLNGGALAEIGWALEEGANQVQRVLDIHGFSMLPAITWADCDLRTFPTTWAKRLAFGRDPRAIYLHGSFRSRLAESAGGLVGEERSHEHG